MCKVEAKLALERDCHQKEIAAVKEQFTKILHDERESHRRELAVVRKELTDVLDSQRESHKREMAALKEELKSFCQEEIKSAETGLVKAERIQAEKYVSSKQQLTREVHLNRAFWQLLCFDTKMNSKWIDCLAEVSESVQILKQPKPSSKKPSLELKGKPHLIEEAEESIKALQSSVCRKYLPLVRPGIAKFFKHSQNRKMLYGIQAQAKVSIEIGTEEQDADERKPSPQSSKFVKVCSGSTRQLKTVNVYVGDITEFNRAEVIVNDANDRLQHFGGVALAIARKGGPVIQEESDEHVRRRGTVETGKAVLFTKTGNLPPPYKAIVHVVGPTWKHSSAAHDRDIALLKKACMRALVCAKSYGSISIPAISSGV